MELPTQKKEQYLHRSDSEYLYLLGLLVMADQVMYMV